MTLSELAFAMMVMTMHWNICDDDDDDDLVVVNRHIHKVDGIGHHVNIVTRSHCNICDDDDDAIGSRQTHTQGAWRRQR